ncbi:MAG: helix-turn-helix transcriptional regulator [Lachnospiraceae bacterium]|nr:helix-turn-helix transcriptional regulator [Lachnospiraceae bacterium]
MSFKLNFLNSLVIPPLFSSSLPNVEDFLGQLCNDEAGQTSPLLHLLSCGLIHASFPFSFDIRSLDCYLLLYTVEGAGELWTEKCTFSLSSSSLLFLDCNTHFRLSISDTPWSYYAFFMTGETLSYYYQALLSGQAFYTSAFDSHEIQDTLKHILSISQENSAFSKLSISNLLNSLLTDCILTASNVPCAPAIPAYLPEVRLLLEQDFQTLHSLDTLASRFSVNKYRLCREFSMHYGIPPLKYLNRQRILAAAKLLQHTDLKIHQIGEQVGIENTNHFISLFRKMYQMTPLEYRHRTAAEIRKKRTESS